MLLFLLLTLLSVTLSLSLYGIRVRWSYVRWSIPGCDRCTHGDDKLRRVEQIYTVSASALIFYFATYEVVLLKAPTDLRATLPALQPTRVSMKDGWTSTSKLEATSTNLCWRAPFRCPHSDASCNDQTGRTTTGSVKIWFGRLFFSHLSLASSSRLHGV